MTLNTIYTEIEVALEGYREGYYKSDKEKMDYYSKRAELLIEYLKCIK
jgi:hypothetical protein